MPSRPSPKYWGQSAAAVPSRVTAGKVVTRTAVTRISRRIVCGQYSGARLATRRPAGSPAAHVPCTHACDPRRGARGAALVRDRRPHTGLAPVPRADRAGLRRGARRAAAVERDAERQVEGAGGRPGLVVAGRRARPRVADDVGGDARGGT